MNVFGVGDSRAQSYRVVVVLPLPAEPRMSQKPALASSITVCCSGVGVTTPSGFTARSYPLRLHCPIEPRDLMAVT
jgi:hypothetical protein